MNFLAHLYLSGDDPDVLVGNMMGDFLKGIGASGYPAAIQEGIRLHRGIDSFTDAHPVFARSRRRFEPPYRRYAGVLVDVFYDHFLAAGWSTYSPHESLASFAHRSYAILSSAPVDLPPRMQRAVRAMAEQDWLGSYASRGGIDLTLQRMSRRPKRPNPLAAAGSQLALHADGLQSDFAEFFPDLIEYVTQQGISRGIKVDGPLISKEVRP
ncbi:MAG TPA: ACP phosphodiesterase [Bryobacterales bacterium]|nr:ACP phosphodiesterase [Bryobacterales bacterium]